MSRRPQPRPPATESSPPPPDPPDDDRIAQVGLAWRELRRGAATQGLRERIYRADAGLIDMGLADALEVVALDGPCRMGELAERLRVDPSTATRTVDRLVHQGYVQRVPDPADARGRLVAATAAGAAVRAQVQEHAREALGEILADFTDEEADRLAALMAKLVAAVDRYLDGLAASPE